MTQATEVTVTTRALVTIALSAVLLAACGGGTETASDDGAGASGESVEVTGTDGLAFEPTQLSAPAGSVAFELTSEATVRHTLAIEGVSSGDPIVEAEAGQTSSGTVTLEPGTYTFFCDVPGHREAGMEGTLDISG